MGAEFELSRNGLTLMGSRGFAVVQARHIVSQLAGLAPRPPALPLRWHRRPIRGGSHSTLNGPMHSDAVSGRFPVALYANRSELGGAHQ